MTSLGVSECRAGVRVYAVSDLHTEHESNWEIVESLVKDAKTAHAVADGACNDTHVLVCAGDIATTPRVMQDTLRLLLTGFDAVFFCPGNNELRISRPESKAGAAKDSIRKFDDILTFCKSIGVDVAPRLVRPQCKVHKRSASDARDLGVLLMPVFAWYTPHFEKGWDGDTAYQSGWLDFRACHFADDLDLRSQPAAAAHHFAAFTQKLWRTSLEDALKAEGKSAAGAEASSSSSGSSAAALTESKAAADSTSGDSKAESKGDAKGDSKAAAPKEERKTVAMDTADDEEPSKESDAKTQTPSWLSLKLPVPVVTFSHFLPRRDLLPWLAVKLKSSFPYVVGDVAIEQQLRAVSASVHVYGHTHIDGNVTHAGVRYVQNALGHPGERKAWWKAKAWSTFLPKLVLHYQPDKKQASGTGCVCQ